MTEAPEPFQILDSSLGRIVVPSDRPPGAAIFWTTIDFDGSLDQRSTRSILETLRALGSDAERLETCRQVHGTRLIEVSGNGRGWSERSECDALWTRTRGSALGIKIADCLPVSIIDSDADDALMINIHAGWRGASAGIVRDALHSVPTAGNRFTDGARAYLGPSIRVCCFEVGDEVVDAFRITHPRADGFVDRTRKKAHVDVAGLVRSALIEEGFASERIWDAGLCTRCEGSIFHSYRRSGPRAGRNLAVIGR